MVDVVLPTPPFWLHIAMTLAGPCTVFGLGSGMVRGGRPVRPSSAPPPSSVMPRLPLAPVLARSSLRSSLALVFGWSCPTVAGQANHRHREHPGKFNGTHLPGLADPRAT